MLRHFHFPAICRLAFSCLAFSCLTHGAQTEVGTRYGAVSGTLNSDLRIFKGIPYATPPVGELRWKSPLPPKPWTGVRESVEFAASCIQPSRVAPQSEDCLYLNIWGRPEVRNAPVMVWIHGGGYL